MGVRMETTLNDWIWFYYNQGFSIIPLGKNKRNDPKAPSLDSWKTFHQRQPTKKEITEWIQQGLFKNIGVICGKVSNNLVVIDIDDGSIPETIGLNFEKMKKNGAWVIQTGKGYHIYTRHHGNPGGIKKPLKYKIEYRANRGYVAAPPSVHPNGNQYHFLNNGHIEEIPELKTIDAKEIFEEMKNKIGDAWKITKTEPKKGSYQTKEISRGYPACVEAALNKVTKPPMRYYTIYGIASAFYFNKIPKDMAMQRIKTFNMTKCVPPHENSIVEQAVHGAYQPEAKRYGCEFWIDQAELCPYEDITECPYGNKKVKHELIKKYRIFKIREKEDKETGKKFYQRVGVHPQRLSELILNEYDFNFITTDDNKEIYYYKSGRYHNGGDKIIRQISQEFMEDQTTTHYKNEVEDYIRDNKYINRSRTFTVPTNLINVKNGVIDLKTNELQPHNPHYYFLNELPVEFNEKADCPKIKKFISEVVYERDIPVLQEFIGYCLYRRYNIHKSFMFLGDGKNGKSTFITMLTKFLGLENVTNKELHDLIYNRFATASLYGKLLNASADISDEALERTGKFKELTGEDMVDAEVKFKDSFSFVNYSKMLFSANKLPAAKDDSYAFYRRWILISFPNTFVGKKCDPNLIEKITTKEEFSGLLNWALEGLTRLLKQGDFSYNLSVEEVMERYKNLSDPEYAYVQEFLKSDSNNFIIKDELFEHYSRWCKKNKLPVTPKNILTQKLSHHLPEIRLKRIRLYGDRVNVYDNISWQDGIKSIDDDENTDFENNPGQQFLQEGDE